MRKTARENAFKMIFERLVNTEGSDITYRVLTEGFSEDDKQFFDSLTEGVFSELEFLGKIVSEFASGYALERVYRIDLAILYLATYEILFIDDVPYKVSVNEAVELAKTYSTDNSPSFINGVLASVVKNKERLLDERNTD